MTYSNLIDTQILALRQSLSDLVSAITHIWPRYAQQELLSKRRRIGFPLTNAKRRQYITKSEADLTNAHPDLIKSDILEPHRFTLNLRTGEDRRVLLTNADFSSLTKMPLSQHHISLAPKRQRQASRSR
ncbi:hypothetical protein F511_02722 [Dorcoceras hygrometricum]|uniref:Uncharacterized protein n=1 Tax=Dorcoceras hygrometricum TaxID=472368 RepID=A0A2Z7A8Y7_9LAMI|nr:hypothetical protein F511_02722 [Dorcoceras hygrometricum]